MNVSKRCSFFDASVVGPLTLFLIHGRCCKRKADTAAMGQANTTLVMAHAHDCRRQRRDAIKREQALLAAVSAGGCVAIDQQDEWELEDEGQVGASCACLCLCVSLSKLHATRLCVCVCMCVCVYLRLRGRPLGRDK